MKHIIDRNNIRLPYTEDFINKGKPNGLDVLDFNVIETELEPNENFIKNKWNGSAWVEGATQEEIEEANKLIVPESISQMKIRKQLILSGIAISSIDALIQSLPQPNRDLIYTMWEYAVVFDRNNPELNAMAKMLNITQQQLDEIFIKGNLL
jgi:hypothetical protein